MDALDHERVRLVDAVEDAPPASNSNVALAVNTHVDPSAKSDDASSARDGLIMREALDVDTHVDPSMKDEKAEAGDSELAQIEWTKRAEYLRFKDVDTDEDDGASTKVILMRPVAAKDVVGAERSAVVRRGTSLRFDDRDDVVGYCEPAEIEHSVLADRGAYADAHIDEFTFGSDSDSDSDSDVVNDSECYAPTIDEKVLEIIHNAVPSTGTMYQAVYGAIVRTIMNEKNIRFKGFMFRGSIVDMAELGILFSRLQTCKVSVQVATLNLLHMRIRYAIEAFKRWVLTPQHKIVSELVFEYRYDKFLCTALPMGLRRFLIEYIDKLCKRVDWSDSEHYQQLRSLPTCNSYTILDRMEMVAGYESQEDHIDECSKNHTAAIKRSIVRALDEVRVGRRAKSAKDDIRRDLASGEVPTLTEMRLDAAALYIARNLFDSILDSMHGETHQAFVNSARDRCLMYKFAQPNSFFNVCGICKYSYDDGPKIPAIITPCGHAICSECKDRLSGDACPWCKRHIDAIVTIRSP